MRPNDNGVRKEQMQICGSQAMTGAQLFEQAVSRKEGLAMHTQPAMRGHATLLSYALHCSQVVVAYNPPTVPDNDLAELDGAESSVADAPPTPLPEAASKPTATLKDLAGTTGWLPTPNGKGLSEASNDPEPYGTAARRMSLALSSPGAPAQPPGDPHPSGAALARVDSVSSSAFMSIGEGGDMNGFEDSGPFGGSAPGLSAPAPAVGSSASAPAAVATPDVFASASAQAALAAAGAGGQDTQEAPLAPEASTDAVHSGGHSTPDPDSPEPGSPKASEGTESWELVTPSRSAPSGPSATSAATAEGRFWNFPTGRDWADWTDDDSVAGSVMGDDEEEDQEHPRRRAASAA
jgi:hypothetical protein